MQYDPVKRRIGNMVNRAPWLRKLFYRLLDILLLRTWHVKKAIRKYQGSDNNEFSVLDAGSGFGQYSYRMHRMNRDWNIKGVDVKDEQIADCTAFFEKIGATRVLFENADLTELVEPNSYNLILSVDVMEHIEDDRSVFKNFYKSLKEGGHLIISTPSDKGGSDVHHDHDESFIDEHVRDGYGVAEIDNKLSEAGFNKVITRYTYGNPGKISWRLSMKIPILLLNRSWLFAIFLPLWYILVMPFALVLNKLDTVKMHREGTGLLVVAIKEKL
jgi:SAM-dependent methyltransferase